MIRIDHLNINIMVEGQGEPMILLHGWGCDMSLLLPIMEYYKDRYQVFLFDLPGFGKSDTPHTIWEIEDYVSLIESILLYYNVSQIPIIIAHSFGARIAIRFALKHQVKQMILTGAAGIKDHRRVSYYLKIIHYKIAKRCHFAYASKMGSEDYLQSDGIIRGILVSALHDDLSKELNKISCPTLLVWGNKDQQTPLWMAKKMERTMKNACLIIFQGEDHFAYFHQMRRFLEVCDCFLLRNKTC
ncbi:MAG: alpha/beta hydrolase [Erysipelotrichaceae bacterium]